MVKVSVIIPVYNVDKYLEECLDSIVNQTLRDIEIICINDGSTDNSLNILNEYAKNDSRITVISQENQGQAVARNYGMNFIKGDYFCFMDADDMLDLNTFEECYNLVKDKSLDFVMYKLINFNDDDKEFYTTPGYDMTFVRNFVKNEVFNYKSLGELIFGVTVSPVNKLFRTDFVFNSNARFPEGTIFEDNLFFWRLFFNAERVFFLDKYYYKRRRHSSSTTGEGSARWVDAIEIYNGVWDIFKEFGHFDEFKFKLYNNKINFALFRLDNIKAEFKELFFQAWKSDLINVEKNYLDFFELLNDDNKNLFNAVLSSDSYDEFSLMRNVYQMSDTFNNLESKIQDIYESINNLLDYNVVMDSMEYQKSVSTNPDIDRGDADQKLIAMNRKLSRENEYLKKEIQKISLKNGKLNDDLRSFKGLIDEFKKLEETNNAILTSNSWKITKPIRSLKNNIKR